MKSWKRVLVFALIGGAVGYGYYLLFGCAGSCPITSSPWRTAAYFGILGVLLSGILPKKP